jgi:N utilization substance protein A
VFSGAVEIKAIAREAGLRSKVAVAARQEGIDPVGCCVGLRGIRIQNIVNELNGEKIDVIQWNPDTAIFVTNALSPAQIQGVELNEKDKIATVIVPDRQLSLAIGKEGQNARLAAKLTGWRIDIKSAATVEAERLAKMPPVVEEKKEAEAVPPVEAEAVLPEVPTVVEEAPIAGEAPSVKAVEPVIVRAEETVPVFFPPGTTEQKPKLRFAEDTGIKRVDTEAKSKKKKKTRKEALGEIARGKGRRRRDEIIVVEEDEEV